MKIAYQWLNDYLESQLSPQHMVELLERAGLEIEEIISPASLDQRIVVAEIIDITPHPDADKLQLVTVSDGRRELKVVCGAPNVRVGQKVALAQPGTQLPDGTLIKPTTIRGEKSNGMLCSAAELGLSDDQSGILELDPSLSPGQPLTELYGDQEIVLDVKVAANRVDLQSILGQAREVAAHGNLALKPPVDISSLSIVNKNNHKGLLAQLDVPEELVPRYAVAKVQLNQPVSASPEWLQRRLNSSGIRPANLIVDLTNYAMLELGQPLHAFDGDKILGKITVRHAKDGEKLTTIDGTERSLSRQDLVIADSRQPVALAGLMGGLNSQIDKDTKVVLLESATFDGPTVRKMANRHGLRTEASSRIERSLPVEFVSLGLERVLQLLSQEAAAEIGAIDDQLRLSSVPRTLNVDLIKFSEMANFEIKAKQAGDQLKSLGFSVEAVTEQTIKVAPPFWRPDIQIEEDVFEEIVKFVGLENIPATLPPARFEDYSVNTAWPKIWRLRDLMQGLGLFEVTTYPFVSQDQSSLLGFKPADHLKLQNPRSSEQSFLRRSLLPGLLAAAANNTRYRTDFTMFEIAKVFLKSNELLPNEPLNAGIILQAKQSAYQRLKGLLDQIESLAHIELDLRRGLQRDYLHPHHQINLYVNDELLGYLGEVHPLILQKAKIKQPAAYLELDMDLLLTHWQEPTAQAISKFQPVQRDVTVLINQDISWLEVSRAIKDSGLAEPSYGGDYRGHDIPNGKRSLTVRLMVVPKSKTLTDREVSDQVAQILALLSQNFKAKLKE